MTLSGDLQICHNSLRHISFVRIDGKGIIWPSFVILDVADTFSVQFWIIYDRKNFVSIFEPEAITSVILENTPV